MFKASRSLFSKLPIRPVVNIGTNTIKSHTSTTSPNQNVKPRNGLQVTPIGLAFIIGGIAYGIYLFKPTKKSPEATLDTFKPQVGIVFGLGDSGDTFKKTAEKLGFTYINVNKNMQKMDELVENGVTKFFIEGFKTTKDMDNMAQHTVQPDIIFDFEKSAANSTNPRRVELSSPTISTISKIVEKHNLV